MTPVPSDEPGRRPEPGAAEQVVRAESGFAYGVIGADIHVFGSGVPVYVLENWRPAPQVDPDFLRELPSRMLNARFAVVEFTGRRRDLARLRQWREEGPRLAACWLHAPGGTGKTRLVDRFAQECLDEGWKVITAAHGPGTAMAPPGSQDLRLEGSAGLLLVIDYADRWPLNHLTWLFSNALLHQSAVRTRILMVGRSSDAWPAVRAALVNHQAGTTALHLLPLPLASTEDAGRLEMFTAARDSFAALYAAEPAGIDPPEVLHHEDLGLTLAVLMAALVAVDAHVADRPAPRDMAGLTMYLLDREHLHWERLHGDTTHEIDPAGRTYVTPSAVMNQAVFAATLTGPVAPAVGNAVVGSLPIRRRLPAERVIADHAVCYPPAAPEHGLVLEPLYPDRLAEDFLALTLPGHDAEYPAKPWAAAVSAGLLARDSSGAPPPWTPRAVTFLATAAERWPHLGPRHLYPVVRADPRLALTAGSPALTALAAIDDVDLSVLEAVESCFTPDHRDVNLDIGIAAVAVRLADHRLSQPRDAADRAGIHHDLGIYLQNAGRHDEALAAAQAAVTLYRELARSGSPDDASPEEVEFPFRLSIALHSLGIRLDTVGRAREALSAAEESADILRRLASRDAGTFEPALARGLGRVGKYLAVVGRWAEATERTGESLAIYRRRAAENPTEHEPELASALASAGMCLAFAGRWNEAVDVSAEGASVLRRLASQAPGTHEPNLAITLRDLAMHLTAMGRIAEAVDAAQEAVAVNRRLAAVNPAEFEPALADTVTALAGHLSAAGRGTEGLAAATEAVEISGRLARANPAAYDQQLAHALSSFCVGLFAAGRWSEWLTPGREAVRVWRRLAAGDPAAHTWPLVSALALVAGLRAETGSGLAEAQQEITEALTFTSRPRVTGLHEVPADLAEAVRGSALRIAEALDGSGDPHHAGELRRLLSAASPPAPATRRP